MPEISAWIFIIVFTYLSGGEINGSLFGAPQPLTTKEQCEKAMEASIEFIHTATVLNGDKDVVVHFKKCVNIGPDARLTS